MYRPPTDESIVHKARLAVISGVICIAIWAVAALGFNGPGYVHLLLSVGLFLTMYGITMPESDAATRPDGKSRSHKME
jgi:hypothetical protein